jgi:magnesium chelatase subunit I
MPARHHAMSITAQEAWVDRPGSHSLPIVVPPYLREIVEEVAFQARADQKVDRRSGVSQRLPISCLESAVSNAERRALVNGEAVAVPRVTDVFMALPAITGKFELEYEGELRGADTVARDLIRMAVANVFTGYFDGVDLRQVIEWFDMGGSLRIGDSSPAAEVLEESRAIQGLLEALPHAGAGAAASAPEQAAAIDFVLEGLAAQKKITRSDDWRFQAAEGPRKPSRSVDSLVDRTLSGGPVSIPGSKKKYYN